MPDVVGPIPEARSPIKSARKLYVAVQTSEKVISHIRPGATDKADNTRGLTASQSDLRLSKGNLTVFRIFLSGASTETTNCISPAARICRAVSKAISGQCSDTSGRRCGRRLSRTSRPTHCRTNVSRRIIEGRITRKNALPAARAGRRCMRVSRRISGRCRANLKV